MTEKCAIVACYVNIQTVPTRSCFKVILELPLERMAEFFQKFGTPPLPGETKWVGMALMDKLAVEEQSQVKNLVDNATTKHDELKKSRVVDLAKARYAEAGQMEQARIRAVILCKNIEFQRWAGVLTEHEAIRRLYELCGIESRRDIGTDGRAFEAFLKIEDAFNEETGRQTELRS